MATRFFGGPTWLYLDKGAYAIGSSHVMIEHVLIYYSIMLMWANDHMLLGWYV